MGSNPALQEEKSQFGEARVDRTFQVLTHEVNNDHLNGGDDRSEASFNDQVGEPEGHGVVEGSVELLQVQFAVLEELRHGGDGDEDGEESVGGRERKPVTNTLDVVLQLEGSKTSCQTWARSN